MGNKGINIKDVVSLVLSVGLMMLLTIIVTGDFYVALKENRPVDDNVIELLQMSITGIIGIIAGYLGAHLPFSGKNNEA
tara:strand:- start:721 stop:957 length:237 start_codon:yes stop_codon:yes gene_type:complete